MDKNEIEKQAEREGQALYRQGRYVRERRLDLRADYNKVQFTKFFKGR